jgi:UDP-glucose 4-epimerase
VKLVTGGAGFIGSAVARRLLELGHKVRVVDDFSKGDQTNIPSGCDYLSGDISDPELCREAFTGVDICFHLAAKVGGIGYLHRYPADILDENNHMLSRVFRTATEAGVKVVYVSSSSVFGRATELPTPEDALDRSPAPFFAYGFSKLVGEWYCRAFAQQYGTPFTICRPFNAYGPGEFPANEPGLAHVIPDLIRKIMEFAGEPLEIFGDGHQSRCFTYVDDLADGIVTAGLHPDGEGEDFNIGTDVETTILELIDHLWVLCGSGERPEIRFGHPIPVDVRRRVPDVSKMRDRFGWAAKTELGEGLRRTVEWYRSVRAS